MDSNPPMHNKYSADIQDDSSMNSDPSGFNFENKKNLKKTGTIAIDSSKKRSFELNPNDKKKTVGFKDNS
jgi:hypothetical protein